jgi:hypothetical protein
MEIIDYWKLFKINEWPYIHQSDSVLKSQRSYKYKNYEDYISSKDYGQIDSRFHFGLLPSPYCGDILNASIYILMLNPGFSSIDYYAEQYCNKFREAEINCLNQNENIEFPFYCLNPEFIWTGGGAYWENKLNDIIKENSKIKNINYIDSTREISQKVALLELIPYHSLSYQLSGKIEAQVESKNIMKNFVKDYVYKKVLNNNACIIITRKVKIWDLPNHNNIIAYEGGETRGAHLTSQSRGGHKILEYLN